LVLGDLLEMGHIDIDIDDISDSDGSD